jgi:hypothetical protein
VVRARVRLVRVFSPLPATRELRTCTQLSHTRHYWSACPQRFPFLASQVGWLARIGSCAVGGRVLVDLTKP